MNFLFQYLSTKKLRVLHQIMTDTAVEDIPPDVVRSLLDSIKENQHFEVLNFAAREEDVNLLSIGDGNLNYVVRVQSKKDPAKSVICKIAPPFIKCLGPSYPLATLRLSMEWQSLVSFYPSYPDIVPSPIFYDETSHTVCMEDLGDIPLLKDEMIAERLEMTTVKEIAKFMALLHYRSHSASPTMEPVMFDRMKENFSNPAMCGLTVDYIFTKPFIRDDPTNRYSEEVQKHLNLIYDNPDVIEGAKEMKRIFQETKECVVHGDFHTASVMVRDNQPKVIDYEFVFVGPCAFDLGILLAHYMLSYYQHEATEQDNDRHRKFCYFLIDVCKETVMTYFQHMTRAIGDPETYCEKVMREVAGFAGCEMIRRIIGAAHDKGFTSCNKLAEVDALQCGIRLLTLRDKMPNIDRLLFIGLTLC